jgi:hypothetical protein
VQDQRADTEQQIEQGGALANERRESGADADADEQGMAVGDRIETQRDDPGDYPDRRHAAAQHRQQPGQQRS